MDSRPTKDWVGRTAVLTLPVDKEDREFPASIRGVDPLQVQVGPTLFERLVTTGQKEVWLRFETAVGSRLPFRGLVKHMVPPDLLELVQLQTKDARGFVRVIAEIGMAYEILRGDRAALAETDNAEDLDDVQANPWNSYKLKRLLAHAESELETEVVLGLMRIETKLDQLIQQVDRLAKVKSLPKLQTHIVSLSGSGIAFQVPEKIPEGTKLKLFLDLGPKYSPHIQAVGEVVRCISLGNGPKSFGPCKIALKFSNIPVKVQDRIVAFTFRKQRDKLRHITG